MRKLAKGGSTMGEGWRVMRAGWGATVLLVLEVRVGWRSMVLRHSTDLRREAAAEAWAYVV